MQELKRFERQVAGRTLSIEVGRMANQAHGSCLVRYGDTVVLATAVMGEEKEGMDYFPLTVDYEERLYAAGKIKGSRFIKREGRPSDEAILTTRLVDRSIRPLFDQSIRFEVQVIVTVFCIDQENDPDLCALIAASTALHISKIPWGGPIAAVRLGWVDEKYVVNPLYSQLEASPLDLVVAGTRKQIVMLEGQCKEASEEMVGGAVEAALAPLGEILGLIDEVQHGVGQPKTVIERRKKLSQEELSRLDGLVKHFAGQELPKALGIASKVERGVVLSDLEQRIRSMVREDQSFSDAESAETLGDELFKEEYARMVRENVLKTGVRADGRKPLEIRDLTCEVGVLPRTHGTGLFRRGETQVMSIVTLGSPGAEQIIDGMELEEKKRYMHHYNFPPFSVGETRPMRGPGRREIGHGALAEKALEPVIPPKESFPYTIRVVSEVLESNGSSSQASVCGSTLSLMDAGVPITAPVAGIAMGLYLDLQDASHYQILTDIQGIEDHDGDMDFKVAGTEKGITAIQMDIKLSGISTTICRETLAQAREARLQILGVMRKTLAEPRKELSPYAPRIVTIQIDPDKIREVIGSGGKTINGIIEQTGVEIDIEDSGLVMVTSTDEESMKKAVKIIEDITREIQMGDRFEGKVTQIVKDRNGSGELGAIVQILPGRDGMIHISELDYRHVDRVTDVVNIGDTVQVVVKDVDKERGRISLSRKALLPKPEGYSEDDSSHGRGGGGGFFRRRGEDRGRGLGRPGGFGRFGGGGSRRPRE